jgi:hypothetical protein
VNVDGPDIVKLGSWLVPFVQLAAEVATVLKFVQRVLAGRGDIATNL